MGSSQVFARLHEWVRAGHVHAGRWPGSAASFRDAAGASLEQRRTLIYGAGWAGAIVARSAQRMVRAGILPVGFLDDDPALKGQRVGGLRVHGDTAAMARAQRRTGATTLLVAMPDASGADLRRIVDAALSIGLDVRTVPDRSELADGSLDAMCMRPVRVEDLLRRPMAGEQTAAAHEVFAGRTVLVTGAAGSIGSELARQVMALEPRQVALVDQAESPLYFVLRALSDRLAQRRERGTLTQTSVTAHLEDITDADAMRRLFADVRPDIVLHAAAYKHVPMLEEHPTKAVEANIGGTVSVLDAAEAAGVERFVLVSTDKAVWPSSVMGASKRIAEMVVADAARRLHKPYIAVRFGNAVGSNGSVAPLFQDQLAAGRPLTITDPEMTRYFTTVPEAAWFILGSVAIADGGGLYVLDMGEPVRIIDIARDLVRLSGRDPDSVPIRVIGLRKGEKLHEDLFYDKERIQETEVPRILWAEPPSTPRHIREDVEGLLSMTGHLRPEELRRTLHAYVRASVDSDEGLWGIVETGVLAEEMLGTRPVAMAPLPGTGQDRNGRQASGSPPDAAGPVADAQRAGRAIVAVPVDTVAAVGHHLTDRGVPGGRDDESMADQEHVPGVQGLRKAS